MRIEQLEYITAVSRHGSLRRASEQLHVSQPALSEAIRNLERELGVTLLDRHRSGAKISLAGRDLLQPMADVLESVARLRAAAGDRLATRRLLRIGTVNAGTAGLVLPAVRAFQAQHPASTVEIRNLQDHDIQTSLAEGTLDIGLVNLLDGDDVPPELELTLLMTGRPVAVIPAAHPLARQIEVSADQLRTQQFVGMRAGYLMHRFVHRLFGADLPADWHSVDGAEMGKMMVAEGMGITVLPNYSVHGDPLARAGLIVTRPITNDTTTVTMVALRRRQTRITPIVRDMIQHFRTHAKRPAALSGAALGGGSKQAAAEGGVPTTPEQQWCRVAVIGLHVPHPADDDLVISPGQPVLDRALQRGQHAVQPGAAGQPRPVADAAPVGGQPAAGEVGGQLLLRRGQDVDRERAVRPDRRQRLAGPVEAGQQQWRVER
jgi:DNA-binding transcriptional LysR family regulator